MRQEVAEGTFEVTMQPVAGTEPVVSMSLAKVFHGGLDGTGSGHMLAVRTQQEGSAGYVAMEQVTGLLGGREGTFALQHSGTMDRGVATAQITVIPDSGTLALAGLTGTMRIVVTAGQHNYIFHYTLDEG